jgi:hypothetical protein
LARSLDGKLVFSEADEDVDGNVDITERIHVQVGADYLAVCAWEDSTTMKGWPARRNIPWVFRDLQEAMREYPEAA